MKTKIATIALLSAAFFASCKQELKPQESLPVTENAENISVQENQEFFQQPTEAAPAVTQTPTQVPAQAQTTTTAPGMNPPHGQPGHRCDIAVGAPLNSAPAQKPAAQPTPQPVQPQPAPQVVQQPTQVAPGMNPPHGQPGHRCDIAVGAPLASAPAATN